MTVKDEEAWIRIDQLKKALEPFKGRLKVEAKGKFCRVSGHYGVWVVTPQSNGKARVRFVYDKSKVPDLT